MAQTLVYNSKTLTFPKNPVAWNVRQPVDTGTVRNRNRDKTVREDLIGVQEAIIQGEWSLLSDADFRRNLEQAKKWLQDGGSAQFAYDSTKTVSTTLNGAVSAGASSVVVTSGTGITDGDRYVIRTPSASFSHVQCNDNSGSPTIVLEDTLDEDVADGALFRSELYWEMYLVSPDDLRIYDVERGFYYNVSLTFYEMIQ